MPVRKIDIEELMHMPAEYFTIDVRSPGEFSHAHIPGAISLPLFSDEERKVIGTSYKQRSREDAIKTGLDYFGSKMKAMILQVEQLIKTKQIEKPVLVVHCWRGGMRSAAVAWLLDLYGFDVYQLNGGYKSFRKFVLEQFEKDYSFRIIGGFTGSGKTGILRKIETEGHVIIDLEAIANHKGSAFGGIGMPAQPTQEMFENLLALELFRKKDDTIWLEDESQRIGVLNIPHSLWNTIRKKPVLFMDIPFEQRLQHIVDEYGKLERENLVNSILRIQKRLGPLETKTCINCLLENNIRECFRILLLYYDKTYEKALHNRENLSALLTRINGEPNPQNLNVLCEKAS